ncbi:MAG: HAMP domain-containing sensor histidine kinase [Vampirovibrionales bacterium]|nr:HAMP domain-containing sensor histidine kinase [Vampirovibrionales bacterium]
MKSKRWATYQAILSQTMLNQQTSAPGKAFAWLKEKVWQKQVANRERLRLTQQLIITFIIVVLVPLLGVSFIIYSINQTALRKELLKFTEHTADTIYKDFNTEMGWQQEQSRMMAFYLLDMLKTEKKNGLSAWPMAMNQAMQGIFRLSSDYEVVGLYDADGKPINRAYRHWRNLPEPLKLPGQLSSVLNQKALESLKEGQNVYDIIYIPQNQVKFRQIQNEASESENINTGDAQRNDANAADSIVENQIEETPYYLRIIVPLSERLTLSGKQTGNSQTLAYYVQIKPFRYLSTLIRDHQAIYEKFYIIDDQGIILAGTDKQNLQQNADQTIQKLKISAEDLKDFQQIKPGVTQEFANTHPTIPDDLKAEKVPAEKSAPVPLTAPKAEATVDDSATPVSDKSENAPGLLGALIGQRHSTPADPDLKQIKVDEESDDETPPIEKVVVKMPGTHWGIIIESPYHVRQKYIKRAHEQSLLLILACLTVTVLLALVYIFGINRNFRQLIKGIKAMAEGNYFRRIRLITNFFTPYEIVYLTGEFNRMAKRRAEAWETLEKANEKLAKLDELKSNLIDTVSHELRTPLTNIKGYTSRLLRYDETLDKETRLKSLKTIKQQADRLGRLVDDLLVIPELEKETLRVFPDEVALSDLIERCVNFMQSRFSNAIHTQNQREFTIHYHTDSDDPLTVVADPDRLEQVVLNLLDNAVKYGIGDFPIRVDISPLNHDAIRIQVANASDPIPEEMLQTLFDKFQRLDDSMVRTTRGSGLGLFITKGLVEAMGGHIMLSYHHDQGGEFRIAFTLLRHTTSAAYSASPVLIP